MSPRYATEIISLLTIMATLLPLGLSAQDSALVRRYAAGTAVTAPGRQGAAAQGPYLVRYPNVPAPAELEAWGWIKSLSPRYHILQHLPPDTTLTAWKANHNWKASTQLLNKLASLRGADSLTLIANASAPGPFRVISQPSENVFEVRLAVKDWPLFAASPQLRLADVPRRAKPETAAANADLTVNRVNALHADVPSLRGSGMRISLKETLYDTLDVDLHPRHIRLAAEPARTEEHATIMATLIAGNGNSGPAGMGAAPLARIASSDFARLLPDEAETFAAAGLHAQNHSYGTGIENYYGLEAEAYDAQVQQLDTFLHAFSAGNIGADAPADGTYAGMPAIANLSGSFKQAKNVLVIGGTDEANAITPLSSRGPAYDGRIKPELVAYGAAGTSDAAALVSGIALLVQEQLRLQAGVAPSAALIAAVLINSAKDVGTPGPDYVSGFGAVDARMAVQTVSGRRFATGAVAQGGAASFPVTVPQSGGTLKITLRYTDAPATANAARALVNDLDLSVTDAAGNRFHPLTLSAFPHKDSLARAAIPSRDSLNNTEQIVVPQALAGGYTIRVEGRRVAGQQPFAIAWEWAPAGQFTWDRPANGETLDAGAAATLRWSTNVSGAGQLFVRTGDAGNWQPVSDVPDVAAGLTGWAAPSTFGPMQLRMDAGGRQFTSPVFNVAPRVTPETGFTCEDSALIWWHAAPGTSAYRVYALADDTYRLLGETADTAFAFRPSAVPSGIVAVSAVGPQEGPRSAAHRFAANAPGCYVRNFTADPDASGKVQLRLELGTPIGVKSIRWMRQGSVLGSSAAAGFVYTFTDEAPPRGIVYYRAEIELDNGRKILTDAAAVMITGKEEYLIFPNPAGESTRLMAKALRGQRIVLIDMQGRTVKALVLESLLQEIPLNGLPAGQYQVAVYENEKRTFSARLVKLR